MSLSSILIRAVFGYVFVLLLLRFVGQRALAQRTQCDLVLIIILADLFDNLFWAEVSVSQFVVAAGTLVLMERTIRLVSRRQPRFARLVEGAPAMLLSNGVKRPAALRRERMNRTDLAELLRQEAGLEQSEWAQVAAAQLETSGRLSVRKAAWAQTAQKQDAARLQPLADAGAPVRKH